MPRRDHVSRHRVLGHSVPRLNQEATGHAFVVEVDGLARLLGLTGGIPWWGTYLLVTSLVILFIGMASLLTLRHGAGLRFLAGAAVGIGLELVNQLWLGLWQWNPATFGRLSAPWVISLGLGIGAGLGPVITNAMVQAAYSKRLRIG